MNNPQTPKKTGDQIEDIKKELSAETGLVFPSRDALSSPSSRNLHEVDNRVHNYIRFLHFRSKEEQEGALHCALAHFRAEVPQIISEWPFKPRADLGVVPSRPYGPSQLKRDFILTVPTLSAEAQDQMMGRLEHILGHFAERVKNNEPFPTQSKVLSESLQEGTSRRRVRRTSATGMSCSASSFDNMLTIKDKRRHRLSTL